MKIRALLLLCGVSLVLTSAASADPAEMARGAAIAALPPNQIVAIVRSTGFDPLGRPVLNGQTYVLRALDPDDVEYRLVIDARTGRTVSVRQIAMPGPYQAVPAYGRNDGPVYGRIFGPAEEGFGAPRPPREMPHAKLPPPEKAQLPPPEKAQLPPPEKDARAPLPRPRPYVMESTGSVPDTAAQTAGPPPAAEPQKAPEPPKDNGGAAMPPVTPLD